MEADKRFQHLLEPIRDLAANWGIDLASELEEYLSELENVRISFDEGKTNVNFAEAALLIQNSACIYSKKVEYLYSLLYQTLDVLIQKRKQKQGSSVTDEGVDQDAAFDSDDPFLLPLDDQLEEAKNIDLVEATDVDYQSQRAKMLLMRPPVSLLVVGMGGSSSDGKDSVAQYSINNCVMHPSGALLLEQRGSERIDASLKRTVSAKDDLPFGSPRALFFDDKTGGGTASEKKSDGSNSQPMPMHMADDTSSLHADGAGAGANWDDPNFNLNSDDAAHSLERKRASDGLPLYDPLDGGVNDSGDGDDDKSKSDIQLVRDTRKAAGPDKDLWAVLDPHHGGDAKPKPFKKGQTTRKPTARRTSVAVLPAPLEPAVNGAAFLGNERVRDARLSAYVDVLNTDPLHEMVSRSIRQNSIKAPFWAEFSTLFIQQLQHRKQQSRLDNQLLQMKAERRRRERAVTDAQVDLGEDAFALAGGGGDDDDYDHDDLGGLGDELLSDAKEDDKNEWDRKDDATTATSSAQLGGEGGEATGFEPVPLDEELLSQSKTYEDLLRDHLDSYVSSAQRFLNEAQMSKRVTEWQDKLEPVLAQEETHPTFDIHEYGRRILGTIDATPVLSEQPSKVMDFGVIVTGREKYDVCRHFLASLMLANAGNVEILRSSFSAQSPQSTSAEVRPGKRKKKRDEPDVAANPAECVGVGEREQEQVALNSFQLRLLSAVPRLPDMDSYRAPGAQATEAPTPTLASSEPSVANHSEHQPAALRPKPKRKAKPKAKAEDIDAMSEPDDAHAEDSQDDKPFIPGKENVRIPRNATARKRGARTVESVTVS